MGFESAPRFGTNNPTGNVDVNRVMPAAIDSVGNIEDHILGYMPNHLSLRPHHDPYRCPCIHCTHLYEFDVAPNYFDQATGRGTITVPCCCCQNPSVQVQLPNETLTGEFKNKCGCCENRFVLEFNETGEQANYFSAGFLNKRFPFLTKLPCCRHRLGYYGNGQGEGDTEWRYVSRVRIPAPANSPGCCSKLPCCGPNSKSVSYSSTHLETKAEELKQLIASRHSSVFQSELSAPYPASVNAYLDYRLTHRRVCCYPCGSFFSWRMSDSNTNSDGPDGISSIDIRYRGSQDQNNATDTDGRVLLAMGLHRVLELGNQHRLNLPILIAGVVPGLHQTANSSPYMTTLATTVPNFLNGSGMV